MATKMYKCASITTLDIDNGLRDKALLLIFVSEVESARLATVLQENAVLKSEIEILRLKCKNLLEENRRLRQASVTIVSSMQHHYVMC